MEFGKSGFFGWKLLQMDGKICTCAAGVPHFPGQNQWFHCWNSLGLNLKDFLQIRKLVLDQPKMVTLKARTMPESMIWQILVCFS